MAARLNSSSSSSPSHHPIPFSLSDLSDTEITLLTRLLSQPSTPTPPPLPNAAHTPLRALIRATLSPHLLAPIPHQHTIASLFPPTTHLPPSAPLCPPHAPLNAQLTHTIFTALTHELGPRLNALTRPALVPHLTPSQATLAPRLRALHALWLPPRTFRARFGSDADPQWRFQADGCEACMLARVGAEKRALVALRTVLVSRRQKGRPAPRLLRWVDGWIAAVGGQEGEALRVAGGVDGRELRRVRRAAREERMGGGGERGGEDAEGLEAEGAGAGGGEAESEGGGFEIDIIEHYAALPSSTQLPLPRAEAGSDHFSDCDSWQSGRQSGSSFQSRRQQDREVGEAERHAEEYRALLGSRASSDRSEGERRSDSTTWSAFLRR